MLFNQIIHLFRAARYLHARTYILLAMLLIAGWTIAGELTQSPKYELVILRGKVIELGPHLLQKYQMPMDDDLGKNAMVLLTDSSEVHPLIKDLRSRGYWLDKRLRDRPMELHVHRFAGLPFVRLIDAYSIKNGKKHRVDYWCAICAITTFEPGPCPCCQDEIELREVLVE